MADEAPYNWQQLFPGKNDGEWAEFLRQEARANAVKQLLAGPDAYWEERDEGYVLVIPEDALTISPETETKKAVELDPEELSAVLTEWNINHVIGALVDLTDTSRRDIGITIAAKDFRILEAQRDYLNGHTQRK